MRHPSPAALLEVRFAEKTGVEAEAVAAHARQCTACAAFLDEVRRLERALAPAPDEEPPPDGLERVLARVASARPVRARRSEWARAVFPSAAAVLAGGWTIRAGADWLAASGLVPGPLAGSLAGEVVSLSLSTLGVVSLGALVTLAFAPVLILESHGRPRCVPRRS